MTEATMTENETETREERLAKAQEMIFSGKVKSSCKLCKHARYTSSEKALADAIRNMSKADPTIKAKADDARQRLATIQKQASDHASRSSMLAKKYINAGTPKAEWPQAAQTNWESHYNEVMHGFGDKVAEIKRIIERESESETAMPEMKFTECAEIRSVDVEVGLCSAFDPS